MKKFFALICTFLLMVVSVTASASESRASQYFHSYSISITPMSGGRLSVRFSVTAVEESTQLGVSIFQLQKKVNGEYVDVGTPQSGSVGYGVIEHTFTRSCQGVAGELYRVEAFFVCENSVGYKTQQVYSGSTYAIE